MKRMSPYVNPTISCDNSLPQALTFLLDEVRYVNVVSNERGSQPTIQIDMHKITTTLMPALILHDHPSV
jgi:hypothetical protein